MVPPLSDNSVPLQRPDLSPLPTPQVLRMCQVELDKLFPDRLQKIVLKAQMDRRIRFYLAHLQDFFQRNQLFEFYDQYSNNGQTIPVYVMRFNHIQQLGNLRIFFVLQDKEIYLVHAFQEKKKADYAPAYEVVKGRLTAYR